MRRSPFLLLVLALSTLLPGLAAADDVPLSPEEQDRLEAIDRHTERAWKAFHSGNHEEVLARAKRLRKYKDDTSTAELLTAQVLLRTGKYDEALSIAAAAVTRWPDDLGIAALHYRILATIGRWDDVKAAALATVESKPGDLVAWAFLGLALEERGDRKAALEAYDKIVNGYNEILRAKQEPDPASVPFVALAAVHATWLSPNPADDMLPGALKLVRQFALANPKDLDVRYQIGELLRSDAGPKGQSQARKRFRKILKDNSEYPDARVGMARSDLVFYRQSAALEQLKRALATNPNHVGALTLGASINVGNGDYEAAEKALAKALAIDPTNKEARSVKGALHWIRGETEAYEALEKEVLDYDPTWGGFHLTCAELIGERQRRYDEAAEFARKALSVDPTNRWAYVVLGESYMNTGETDEALTQFRLGVKASKGYADVRRDNWIEVVGQHLPRFDLIETEHFRIRMPKSESRVMRHYLPELLEESYTTLCSKYGIDAQVPTFADSFDRQDDFSVRSVGTAGLPALGVCFGNVITLLGPTSMPPGGFSWSRTAWHEFAHVVTLQLSKGQVPRWLTEGLSVFEEQQRRTRWGRDMEKQLYDRWHNGRLLKMKDINSAFRGPDIMFAYFQGGLIASHLQQDRGFDVIPKMLRAFAEDKSTAEVFKAVLDIELDKYDEEFSDYVETIVGGFRMVPIWDEASMKAFLERTEKDPDDVEAWIRLAWGHFQRGRAIDAGAALATAVELDKDHPEVVLLSAALARANSRADIATEKYEQFLAIDGQDDLQARLFLADRALTQGTDSSVAIAHLEAAKRCFPRYIARNSPYLQLARLYRGGGDFARSIRELEAFAEIAAEDYGVRKELRTWYKQQDDWQSLARVCEEMVDITPFGANVKQGEAPDMALHKDYAEALGHLGRHAEQLRELEVQVELGRILPEEKQIDAGVVRDRLTLGRLYLTLDRPEDALEQALAALRLAPSDADALMLKQRASEAGGSR